MRNKTVYLFLMVLASACTQQETSDSEPLSPVKMVPKLPASDTLANEPGIDAVPSQTGRNNYIQIMWRQHERRDEIEMYHVYRTKDPQGEALFQRVGSKVPDESLLADTVYIDKDSLNISIDYFYYVTVVNQQGVESAPSDTVRYRLIQKSFPQDPIGDREVTTVPISFEWDYPGIVPDRYILRIERYISETFHPLVLVQYVEADYNPPQRFTLSGSWPQSAADNGKYRWRIDAVGTEALYEGSESDWAYFNLELQ